MKPFINLVESLSLNTSLKNDLTNSSLLKAHSFYINLVDYLLPLFPEIEIEKAEKLSISGYLYFRFLLFFDNYVDESKHDSERNANSFHKLLVAFEFYEKSIRDLSSLFPNDTSFWSHFRKLKKGYFESVVKEKYLSATKLAMTEETFHYLAASKSSICNAMVYALSDLANNQSYNKQLVLCLDNLHIALQYLDDIEDFKVDIQNKQWTYARSLVNTYLQEKSIDSTDPVKQYKYLFLSGIASNSIVKAIEHLNVCIAIARELNLPELLNYLTKKKSSFEAYSNEITLLIEKTKIKTSKKNELLKRSFLKESIQDGISYLERNLENNHTWSDFLTSAGFGKAWITAYVGLQLAECDYSPEILNRILKTLSENESNSFNETIIRDGDSSTFMIGFRKKVNDQLLPDETMAWLSFKNNDGGWVTYRNGAALQDRLNLENISVYGWLTPKNCVTAAAAYVLSFVNELEAEYKQTCNYLINSCSPDGAWSSYWWTSSIYASALSIMALSAHDDYKQFAVYPSELLAEKQHSDGYWTNELLNVPSPFYTAISIKALLLHNPIRFEASIRKSIHWLLQHQTADGSWLTNRILQIPATDVNDPGTITNWRQSSLGVNCVVDDHNRVFTTSTVVNALSLFGRTYNHVIDSGIQYEANAEKP